MELPDRVKKALIIYAVLMFYVIHQASHFIFNEIGELKLNGPIPAPVIIIGLAILSDYLGSFLS